MHSFDIKFLINSLFVPPLLHFHSSLHSSYPFCPLPLISLPTSPLFSLIFLPSFNILLLLSLISSVAYLSVSFHHSLLSLIRFSLPCLLLSLPCIPIVLPPTSFLTFFLNSPYFFPIFLPRYCSPFLPSLIPSSLANLSVSFLH